jgi:formiminotetrahydrofolate cyclodeaminase
MSETLWGLSLAAFRDAITSTEPTPGGGSVAMVSATFGLGLVIMGLEITARKPPPSREALLAALREEGRGLLRELSAHADGDVAVFRRYMAASRLPRATGAERTAREQALQEALVDATRAPLNAVRTCVAALELATKSAGAASLRVVSDVGTGAALVGGAVSGILLNVDMNLSGIADARVKAELARARADLGAQAVTKAASASEIVAHRIAAGN